MLEYYDCELYLTHNLLFILKVQNVSETGLASYLRILCLVQVE